MPQSAFLIPLQTAIDWTTAWRAVNANAIKAYTISSQEINDIMAETGAVSIRLYFGLDNGVQKLVLVGVDATGKDIINPVVKGQVVSGTYDFVNPCPPTCDATSPLMT